MKIKIFTLLTALFIISNIFAQSNLNDYKYIIVPKKYDFLKEANQYRLNELTEFLFDKYGFETIMEGDKYPEDLIRNRCLALKSDVTKDSGLFKTKLNVELKDCNDQLVYTSLVGESREKDYGKAYNEALRGAFKSFETINYIYQPKEVVVATDEKVDTNKEIERLKQEIEDIKQAKEVELINVVVPEEDVKKSIDVNTTVKEVKYTENGIKEVLPGVLYAQAIDNGFQLVDSSPKVVYKIKKTSLENVFLVEGLDGTLLNKKGEWILEYYENGSLKQKVLNIKF